MKLLEIAKANVLAQHQAGVTASSLSAESKVRLVKYSTTDSGLDSLRLHTLFYEQYALCSASSSLNLVLCIFYLLWRRNVEVSVSYLY